jgi:hypothetical protein
MHCKELCQDIGRVRKMPVSPLINARIVEIDEKALKDLVRAAVALNAA